MGWFITASKTWVDPSALLRQFITKTNGRPIVKTRSHSCLNHCSFTLSTAEGFLAVGFLLALVAVVICVSRHEIGFEGKPFDYWLDRIPGTYLNSYGPCYMYPFGYDSLAQMEADQPRAEDITRRAIMGVRALGTNHLKMLVARLQAKDLPFENIILRGTSRLGFVDHSLTRGTQMRRWQALSAIVEMGERARPILPQLIELTKTPDRKLRLATLYAIVKIAPEEIAFTTIPIEPRPESKAEESRGKPSTRSFQIPVGPTEAALLQPFCGLDAHKEE